jgi:NADH dehydrogenase [ubiquinone] 1 alpha subcomplex assembly factor 6
VTIAAFVSLYQERDAESGGPPETITALEQYAESTASSLLYLALEAVDVRNTHADHCASHIGKAAGIVTAIRGLPFHLQRGLCYLPAATLADHQLTVDDVHRFASSAGSPTPDAALRTRVQDAVFAVAKQARAHLDHVHELAATVPAEAAPALLAAVSTRCC